MRLLAALVSALAATPPHLGRVVSVADLHGDLRQALLVFTAAGLVDEHTHAWIGGNTTLVQTGDIVDRGDAGKEIYELMFKLVDEAPASGGKVVMLLGNHDHMNMVGDLRYVSIGDYKAFGGKEARKKAWGPDGWLGERARHFAAAALLEGTLFGHAGPLPHMIPEGGIHSLNEAMYEAVEGKGPPQSIKLRELVGDNGPLWTRVYSMSPESKACPAVDQLLTRLAANRLVVGHTVQPKIRTRCNGRIVLADTGMSHAYGGPASFVEYVEGNAWAVYPPDQTRHLLPRPASLVAASPPEAATSPPRIRKASESTTFDQLSNFAVDQTAPYNVFVIVAAVVSMIFAVAGVALRSVRWQRKRRCLDDAP